MELSTNGTELKRCITYSQGGRVAILAVVSEVDNALAYRIRRRCRCAQYHDVAAGEAPTLADVDSLARFLL